MAHMEAADCENHGGNSDKKFDQATLNKQTSQDFQQHTCQV